ncbi:MAG: octaprenyl-diphosphate synthase [Clostridia bacterium]|nr:octaprenyl-diphosphate synthase [Clostridia bacterium]
MSDLFKPVNAEIREIWRQLEMSWKVKGRGICAFPPLSFWDRELIPALTVLIAGLYRQQGPKVISLAVIMEYIHLATRVHKSVKANVARPTLWGDYLYARFFELVCSEGNYRLLTPLGKLISSIHLNEVKRARAGAGIEEIVAGERGRLLAEVARLSGLLAGSEGVEEAPLYNFGFTLGMCWGLEEVLPGSSKKYAAQARACLACLPDGWQRGVLLETIASLTAGDRQERSLAL